MPKNEKINFTSGENSVCFCRDIRRVDRDPATEVFVDFFAVALAELALEELALEDPVDCETL